MLHTIRTSLWPTYGHYNSGNASPLSVLALHIQIFAQHGNLIDGAGKAGQFLFRNTALPIPRACTYSAWRELVGLGGRESPFFYIPFLPSSRVDEESGIAGSLRGPGNAGTAHLKTLTRQSKIHVRDVDGRISWGAIYIGRWDRPQSPLVMELARSDIPESFFIPRRYQIGDYSSRFDTSIRVRMEFLAQFGIPATRGGGFPIRNISRLMFQTLDQTNGLAWAEAYLKAKEDYDSDLNAEREDYAQLIHELRSRKPIEKVNSTKKSQKKVDFEIDFEAMG